MHDVKYMPRYTMDRFITGKPFHGSKYLVLARRSTDYSAAINFEICSQFLSG